MTSLVGSTTAETVFWGGGILYGGFCVVLVLFLGVYLLVKSRVQCPEALAADEEMEAIMAGEEVPMPHNDPNHQKIRRAEWRDESPPPPLTASHTIYS